MFLGIWRQSYLGGQIVIAPFAVAVFGGHRIAASICSNTSFTWQRFFGADWEFRQGKISGETMKICQNHLSKDFETQKGKMKEWWIFRTARLKREISQLDFRDFRTQNIRTSDNQSRDEITSEVGTHPSKMRTRSRLVSQLAETLAGLNIAPGTGFPAHGWWSSPILLGCCCMLLYNHWKSHQSTGVPNIARLELRWEGSCGTSVRTIRVYVIQCWPKYNEPTHKSSFGCGKHCKSSPNQHQINQLLLRCSQISPGQTGPGAGVLQLSKHVLRNLMGS